MMYGYNTKNFINNSFVNKIYPKHVIKSVSKDVENAILLPSFIWTKTNFSAKIISINNGKKEIPVNVFKPNKPAKNKIKSTAIVIIIIIIVMRGKYNILNLFNIIFIKIADAIIIKKKKTPSKRPIVKKIKTRIVGIKDPRVFIPRKCLNITIKVIIKGNANNKIIVSIGIFKLLYKKYIEECK